MDRDGNGWVQCADGHTHWGVHGAAGLLLHTVDEEGQVRTLLQHRAAWSHHGDTWGLPGGARDSHEDVRDTALREATEEAGLGRAAVRTRHLFVDDHGGWSYTTVYADTPTPLPTTLDAESVALEWVRVQDVTTRRLHPGFAATWADVRPEPTVLLVDTANVLGARPNGWWRDRAGASTGLLRRLAGLRAATLRGPDGRPQVIAAVVAVLEGAATTAADPEWVQVVRTARDSGLSGDDTLVTTAGRLLESDTAITAVTADRGLRDRLAMGTSRRAGGFVRTVGPNWLWDALPSTREDGPTSGR